MVRSVFDRTRYVQNVQSLASQPYSHRWLAAARQEIASGLDVGETAVAQRLRRRFGVYLTPPRLAKQAASQAGDLLSSGKVVGDPTCGAGDLLLALIPKLEPEQTLDKTLTKISKQIRGTDRFPELVELAKWRLLLAARVHHHPRETVPRSSFGVLDTAISVRHRNLAEPFLDEWDCFLMNPPFAQVELPKNTQWGTGRCSAAALFTMKAAEQLGRRGKGALVAILPDSLRSGARYTNWRHTLTRLVNGAFSYVPGPFSPEADIHTAILMASWPAARVRKSRTFKGPTLGGVAKLSVGPVVPHRDRIGGSRARLLDARLLRLHATSTRTIRVVDPKTLPHTRRTTRTLKPPFIAIARTSRPEESPRLKAALVLDGPDVHVENHVITVKPHNLSLLGTKRLLRALATPKTNNWLSRATRSHHISVSILRRLPVDP